MKRFITFVMSICMISVFMLLSTSTISFAKENGDELLINNGLKEQINSSWFIEGKESTNEKSTYSVPTKVEPNTVIHNNGDPLNTNIFEEKNGYELYGIYINNNNMPEYFLTNSTEYDKEELFNDIIDKKNSYSSKADNAQPFATGTGSYSGTYNWKYYFNGKHIANFSQTVEFARRSSSTVINGTRGSVWDVNSFGQLEVVAYGYGLIEQYTRLDSNYTNQTLVSWGPHSTSSGNITFSLSGITPSMSYTFNPKGYETTDLSSKSNKYGRWRFRRSFLSQKSLVTNPAVRITNTKGKVGLKLSNTFDISGSSHQTGIVTMYYPDR